MSRWLAATFAVLCVIGSAVAVWLVVIDGDDGGGSGRNIAQAATADPPASEPAAAGESETGESNAAHFTVSASGDLLMHQPLLDRALANGGGDEYDFAPFFKQIKPYVEGVDLGLCHMETPMGPGPPTTYPIFNTPTGLATSVHRSGWDACSTASNHSLDGGQAGIDGTVKALDQRRRRPHRLVRLQQGEPKADDPRRRRGQGRLRRLHRRDQRPPPAAFVVGQRLRRRRSEGRREGDHPRRPRGPRGRRRGGDRPASLGRRELPEPEQLAGRGGEEADRREGDHGRRRPGTARGAADRAHQRQVRRLQRGQPGLQPERRGRACPPRPRTGSSPCLHFKAVGDRVTVRRVTYAPTWVRLGDYVVLPAKPSASSELRRSHDRTVDVVGKGEGFGPEY